MTLPASPAGKGGGTSGTKPPFLVQPPFDKRITSLTFSQGTKKGGAFQRGFMIWDRIMPGYKKKARVNFLYNPSTISASYMMQDSNYSSALLFQDWRDQAQIHVPYQQTVSWSLLYDRTFELWGAYNTKGVPRDLNQKGSPITDASVGGVGVDIMAMEQFTGMLLSSNRGVTGAEGSGGVAERTKRQGAMMLATAWVYFGSATGLNYYGYVADWSVQVTHWTQYMVPMRAVISLDFNLFPPPTDEPGTGTGVESWWSLIGTPSPIRQSQNQNAPPSTGVGGR